MKKHILSLILLLIGITAFAQNPEFSGRPYIMQNKKLTDLERVDAQFDQKHKMLGYGGVEIYYTVFTDKSSVRFSKAELPKLVIQVEKGIDPAEKFTIIKAKIKKGKRNFTVGNYGMGGKAKSTSDTQVAVTFKKIKENFYEILLPNDIQAGEYAFVPNGTDAMSAGNKMKITCFGIDN